MMISPETRIGPLLDAHPELVEALIAYVPAMGKLKNLVLRRTVAQVATLEQVSRMAGVPLPELLAFLRLQLGQEAPEPGSSAAVPAMTAIETGRPAWYDSTKVILQVDVTTLLATGEHPLARVRKALAQSRPGDIVELRSDFEPAPLIATLREEGGEVWCSQEAGVYRTCILHPA